MKRENDDHPEYIDTSRTDKYDMSRTDWDNAIENMKAMKNKNNDGEYKEYNSRHQHSNETLVNKTKE